VADSEKTEIRTIIKTKRMNVIGKTKNFAILKIE
jgi:hypothetical protein